MKNSCQHVRELKLAALNIGKLSQESESDVREFVDNCWSLKRLELDGIYSRYRSRWLPHDAIALGGKSIFASFLGLFCSVCRQQNVKHSKHARVTKH